MNCDDCLIQPGDGSETEGAVGSTVKQPPFSPANTSETAGNP